MSSKQTRAQARRRRRAAGPKLSKPLLPVVKNKMRRQQNNIANTRRKLTAEQEIVSAVNRYGPAAVRVAGKFIGNGLQRMIRGFGDYTIANNSLMNGLDPPTVRNSPGGMIIRHREYIGDITASTGFSSSIYPIQPGLFTSFPWLSGIAPNFEQYKWRGILYEFKSLASDAVLSTATSSALGSVVMATQYDVRDPPFPDKFIMENYQYANSSKPSLSFIHPVECARSQSVLSELYVRTSAPPINADQRLYDLGNFTIATVGMQASTGVVGELWVTYEIEFMKPKLADFDLDVLMDHYRLSVPSSVAPFGNNFTSTAGSTLNGTLTPTVYSFPPELNRGTFLLNYSATNNGLTSGLLAATVTLANCSYNTFYRSGTIPAINNAAAGNLNNTLFQELVVNITGRNASITFASPTLPVGILSGDLIIVQLPTLATLQVVDDAADDYENVSLDENKPLTQAELYDMLSRIADMRLGSFYANQEREVAKGRTECKRSVSGGGGPLNSQ